MMNKSRQSLRRWRMTYDIWHMTSFEMPMFDKKVTPETTGHPKLWTAFCERNILVPRGRAPFGQHQFNFNSILFIYRESRPLGRSNFLSMRRVIVLYSHPIRFADLTLSVRRVTGSLWITDFRCWTFLEVAILGADPKERGLWGRECERNKVNLLRLADCYDRETPVNVLFDKSLIFCPKIPLGDLIRKIIFKGSNEFLFFRNSRKFESAVKVRFFVE